VPLEYDPLLAKLVAWGEDRAEAVARMRRALAEYEVFGVQTNVPFFRRVLEHPDFLAGEFDTGFIDRVLAAGLIAEDEPCPESELVAMLAAALAARRQSPAPPPATAWGQSAWKTAGREALLRRWPRGD
ncbi:MAG: acetyl-CoA carboxylase biotin carboxylase subunit, partial [Acidobacteria bacterium]|nr:acetyl-CoA carboxylase biotin carboxylase subunit [Acidobacteriota bacterium]